MSSFICDTETFNRIYGFLMRCKYSNEILQSEVRSILQEHKLLKRHEYGMIDSDEYDKVIRMLMTRFHAMNVEAVNQRYAETQLALPEIVEFEEKPCTTIEALKSLHCLRYQCSEGNVPDSKLYKFLESLIQMIEHHIVCSIPEYNKAAWG